MKKKGDIFNSLCTPTLITYVKKKQFFPVQYNNSEIFQTNIHTSEKVLVVHDI